MVHLYDSELEDLCFHPTVRKSRTSQETGNTTYASAQATAVTRRYLAPQKKKVGRPITYKGDPSSKTLSESERRRIKRRVANRESARRVRAKRAETLEELQIKMGHLSEDNSSLLERVSEAETSKALIEGQVQDFCLKLKQTTASSKVLQQELATLKKQLNGTFSMDLNTLTPSIYHNLFDSSQQLNFSDIPCSPTMLSTPSMCIDNMASIPFSMSGKLFFDDEEDFMTQA